jgi:hypothetical protein
LPGAANLQFLSVRGNLFVGTANSKAALETIEFASAPPLIPNFAQRMPRSDAKFGIGALELGGLFHIPSYQRASSSLGIDSRHRAVDSLEHLSELREDVSQTKKICPFFPTGGPSCGLFGFRSLGPEVCASY